MCWFIPMCPAASLDGTTKQLLSLCPGMDGQESRMSYCLFPFPFKKRSQLIIFKFWILFKLATCLGTDHGNLNWGLRSTSSASTWGLEAAAVTVVPPGAASSSLTTNKMTILNALSLIREEGNKVGKPLPEHWCLSFYGRRAGLIAGRYFPKMGY